MLRLKRCVFELLELGSPKVFASWMLIKRALHPVNRFETERCWVVSDDTFVDACLPEAFFSAGAFLLSRTQQRFLERNPEKAQWENVKMAIWDDWGLHFSAFNKWIIAVNFARWPKRKELFLHTKEGNQLDIYIYIQTSHPNKKPPKPILVGPLLKPMARLPGSMEVYSEDELRGMLAREISKRPWPTVGTVVSIAHDAWRDWGMWYQTARLKEGHPKFHCRHHLLCYTLED